MNFINAIETQTNWKQTENGQDAFKSTTNDLLDFYATMGALRTREKSEKVRKFAAAYAENPLYAMKALFYCRDIRGGLGERDLVRDIFQYLADNHPSSMRKNLPYIAEFGRWDDLYSFVDTQLEKDAFTLIRAQLEVDYKNYKANKPISLLAKWLKSVNSSSAQTRALGRKTAKSLGLSEKDYRQTLSKLRAYLLVTETQISANEWGCVDYETVPSVAMNNYYQAFKKHDEERFNSFLNKVEVGEAKINAGALYPYDILERAVGDSFSLYSAHNSRYFDKTIEALWKALPNYIEGENNIMIMADTSGSMCGRPMATSVGLAIYFAERNKGLYHNKFMTFSSKPSFVTLKGTTLYEKVRCIPDICDNTNLEAAFELILSSAVNNKVPVEEMPKALVVITDMEFDACVRDNSGINRWYIDEDYHPMSFYENMRRRFAAKGYKIPNIIFWNASARHDTFHASSDQIDVQMVSGQSTAVFKSVLNNMGKTAYEAMIDTLSDERYACITD